MTTIPTLDDRTAGDRDDYLALERATARATTSRSTSC